MVLGADDLPTELVHVPQWNVTVAVRAMSMAHRNELVARGSDPETGEMTFQNLWAEIVVTCCVDPVTGEQLFLPSDGPALNAKNSAALELVANAAARVSGLPGPLDETSKPRSGGC
jgi:hypothetical protein